MSQSRDWDGAAAALGQRPGRTRGHCLQHMASSAYSFSRLYDVEPRSTIEYA